MSSASKIKLKWEKCLTALHIYKDRLSQINDYYSRIKNSFTRKVTAVSCLFGGSVTKLIVCPTMCLTTINGYQFRSSLSTVWMGCEQSKTSQYYVCICFMLEYFNMSRNITVESSPTHWQVYSDNQIRFNCWLPHRWQRTWWWMQQFVRTTHIRLSDIPESNHRSNLHFLSPLSLEQSSIWGKKPSKLTKTVTQELRRSWILQNMFFEVLISAKII